MIHRSRLYNYHSGIEIFLHCMHQDVMNICTYHSVHHNTPQFPCLYMYHCFRTYRPPIGKFLPICCRDHRNHKYIQAVCICLLFLCMHLLWRCICKGYSPDHSRTQLFCFHNSWPHHIYKVQLVHRRSLQTRYK